MIRKVNEYDDFIVLAKLLNRAFAGVAEEFGLTKDNSPTNNAFISADVLRSQLTGNREFYCYENNGNSVGFVAVERSDKEPGTFYIEKLAVDPELRRMGIGRLLMDLATDRIAALGGKRISIGLINNNIVLKNWYGKQGFREFEVKSFEHLPFDVCLMDKEV